MDSKVTRPESVRKRPLELSNSNNGDALPTKFKPGPTPGSVMDCTAQFAMEQKVHDVEEHFRRSLQSFQSSNGSGGSSFLPVSTGSSPTTRGPKKKTEDSEPQQIVIAENNTSRSSVTTSSPQNLQFIMTSSPSTSGGTGDVPTVISALPGAFPPSFFLNVSSTTDKPEGGAQLLTAAPALASAARKGGGGNIMMPAFQGMIPTIASAPNLIPVIDNSGTTQLIPATSANSTTPGTSPVFYMSPSGIPMLTQGGVVFMNPTDITRSQHISVATPPQHNSSNIVPNYIILPPTFTAATNSGTGTGGVGTTNFSLTLEQLVALNNLQQQHLQQQQQQTETATANNQRVNIDLTSSDDHSSVGSGGSMDDLPDPLPSSSSSANNNNVDSVEEHFARALGDQWHQLKQSAATPLTHSDHNKITA